MVEWYPLHVHKDLSGQMLKGNPNEIAGSNPARSTTVKSINKNVMSKTVRAKFKVDEVTDYGYGAKRVKLSAVYSHDRNSEDNQFSQATPSGSIEMMVTNPDALEFIQPGKSYYVDFSEAEN